MSPFINNVKTVFLLALLFGLIVLVGSFWGYTGMIVAGVIALIMNFVAWFGSHKMAIAAMRGVEIDPVKVPALYEPVERLAQRAGLPVPKVYICPHQAPNAFATGRNPKNAAVAVTEGLFRMLDDEELEGVIAHELAHIKNRDTLIATVAATVAGLFSMMTQWMMYRPIGMRREGGANALLMIGIVILGAVGAAIIKAMISRAREFVADADGASIAGSPDGLINALRKLEAANRRIPLRNPNPAMNNMFIVEPFVGKTLTRLFASHPPTDQRIAALLKFSYRR